MATHSNRGSFVLANGVTIPCPGFGTWRMKAGSETVAAIQAMGKKTVGILATDGTVRTGIYQKECDARNIEALSPPEDIQKLVMSIIYDEIKRGETGSREKFAAIDRWLRQAGCDGAILGCTELSVYRTYHGLPDYYLDAMDVLAQRCITACGYKLRLV